MFTTPAHALKSDHVQTRLEPNSLPRSIHVTQHFHASQSPPMCNQTCQLSVRDQSTGRTPLPRFNKAPCVQLPHDPRCLRHHLAARSNMMWPETCTSTAPHFPASTLPGACRAMQGTDLCLRNPDVVGHESSAQQTCIDKKTPARRMSRRKCCSCQTRGRRL